MPGNCRSGSRISQRYRSNHRAKRLPNQGSRTGRHARGLSATSALCPSIWRARRSSSSRRSMHVRAARARCIASARTSARCSTSCPRSSGSSASGGRATAAAPVKVLSCKRRRHRARWKAGCRPLRCWRTSPYQNLPGICRCTGRCRCWRDRASISTALPWYIGLSAQHGG